MNVSILNPEVKHGVYIA